METKDADAGEFGWKALAPYDTCLTSTARGRWLQRPLVDALVQEFPHFSEEYYVKAVEAGVITVNGARVSPDYIIQNADVLRHYVCIPCLLLLLLPHVPVLFGLRPIGMNLPSTALLFALRGPTLTWYVVQRCLAMCIAAAANAARTAFPRGIPFSSPVRCSS